MSNNKSSSSKVTSVRIPLPEYQQILQMASDKHMTITDFLLQILYKNLNSKLIELNDGDIVYRKESIDVLHKRINHQKEEEAMLNNEIIRLIQKCELLEESYVHLCKKMKGLEILHNIKRKN
jgi:hypothetical protein